MDNVMDCVQHLEAVERVVRHLGGEDGVPLLVQNVPGVQHTVLITYGPHLFSVPNNVMTSDITRTGDIASS